MGDLEVHAQSPQAGVKTPTSQVILSDLEADRQVVGQDGERHVIGQPQPSDLDEFGVGNRSRVNGVANVLIERANGEFEQSGTRNLAGLGYVLVEATERLVPPELRAHDLSADTAFAYQQALLDKLLNRLSSRGPGETQPAGKRQFVLEAIPRGQSASVDGVLD